MPRETIETKARRYLGEGRLHVTRITGNAVAATCRGNAVYDVRCSDGRWTCTCPARGPCSHLRALQLVACPYRNTTNGHPVHKAV